MTVAYVLLFNSLGLDALMMSMIALNYVMWVPSLFIVAGILELPILRYVGSFAVPALATVLMLFAVEGTRVLAGSWPMALRLAACMLVGVSVYAAVVLALARDKIDRIRAIVWRRRA